MGTAMGGLPNHARIRVLSPSTGRRTWIIKRDIGGGGNEVEGVTRGIDLYFPVAQWLAGATCTWTGVIDWRSEEWFDRAHSRRHHRRHTRVQRDDRGSHVPVQIRR